jgi:hypothetical protein
MSTAPFTLIVIRIEAENDIMEQARNAKLIVIRYYVLLDI